MATTRIGPKIVVEGEAEYRKTMTQVIQQAKTLKAEMGTLTSAFDKNNLSISQANSIRQKLTQQINNEKKALSEQAQMLAKAEQKYGASSNQAQKYRQAVEQTKAKINELNKELKNVPANLEIVGAKFEAAGKKMQNIGSQIASVGKSLSMYVTTPLATAGASALKFGMDFDKGMSNVASVSNASEESLAKMREAALHAGETTVWTAKDASDALFYMALAGWSAEESVAALGGVLDLATAGQVDLGRSSDIVTDAMTAMQIAADGYTNGIENATHFSNVMAATMANSNTTVDLLGESFKYVAPVAGTMGYSIEDLNIALGMMASAGVKGSTAGTALRNILSRMAKPTDEVAEAMEELHLKLADDGRMKTFMELMQDMRREFKNIQSEEAFINALEEVDRQLEAGEITEEEYNSTLENLIDTTYDASKAEKVKNAAILAGLRGMSGLMAIVNATDEEFQALTEVVYDADNAFDGLGYAQGMAQRQLENLSGDWTLFTSALGTTKIMLSDIVNGSLREFIQSLTKLVNQFNALDTAQKEQILKWAGIVAAIGPVLAVVGTIIKVVGTVVAVVGKVVAFVSKLGPLLAAITSPAGLFVAAFAAIAAGALYVLTHMEEVKAFFGKLGKFFKEVGEEIGKVMKTMWDDLVKLWNDSVAKIKKLLDDLSKVVGNVWQAISTKVKSAWNGVVTVWNNSVNSISRFIKSLAETMSNVWNEIVAVIQNVWNAIVVTIQNSISSVNETLTNTWTAIYNTTSSIVSSVWNTVVGTFESIKNGISNAINNIWNGITNVFNNIKNTIAEVVSNIWNTLTGTFENIKNSVVNTVKGLWQSVSSVFETIKNTVSGVAESIKNAFSFNWSLPSIKLPHFRVQGSGNPIDWFTQGPPKITVDWYAKAMKNGMILNGATIFGQRDGQLLGGGEKGPEVVVGANSLYNMIQSAVGSSGGAGNEIVINVYGAVGQSEERLAEEIEKRLAININNRKAVFG